MRRGFGAETSGVDDLYYEGGPRRSDEEYEERKVGSVACVKSDGGLQNWADFTHVIHGLMTDELFNKLNSNVLSDNTVVPIFREFDGQLWFQYLSLSGTYRNDHFPDTFTLVEASDTRISFLVTGYYSDYFPQDGETIEERDQRLAASYELVIDFPIELVLTENGWRFDGFSLTTDDKRLPDIFADSSGLPSK